MAKAKWVNPESINETFERLGIETGKAGMSEEESQPCIKEKKFLFWKWKEVEHDFKLFSIEKFMWCSTNFMVTWKCSRCETPKKMSFVSHDELILMGIKPETLNKITPESTLYL